MTRTQLRFEGLEVSEIEVEITGGGTHETEAIVGLGDEGTAIVRWKAVNVKHPIKSGEVQRVQTLNVVAVTDVVVTESYEAPPTLEQPELASV